MTHPHVPAAGDAARVGVHAPRRLPSDPASRFTVRFTARLTARFTARFTARSPARFASRLSSRFPFAPLLRRAAVATLALVAFAGGTPAFAQPLGPADRPIKQPGQFPTVQLSVGLNLIHAEVAANDADREQGLMYRKSLAPNAGMLFVFDERAGHCFWMKNTLIPLSIAFMGDDGTISDIDEMAPETENNHCPTRAGRYALEMEQNWFTKHGIRPGMQVKGLDGGGR